MKISTTLKNNRGGQKVTADDTRIQVELRHGNKLIGTLSLYNIIDDKVEGYRVIWEDPTSLTMALGGQVLKELEKGKQRTGEIWDTMDKEFPKGFI